MQCWVEHAVNFDLELSGLSADIQTCFNNIERPQVMYLSEHIGFCSRILRPWAAFLGAFERRFGVRTAVNRPILSDRRIYLEAYTPKATCRSFVDNISIMTRKVEHLVTAMNATITYLELWGLKTDQSKTYVWCTTASGRQQLRSWNYELLYDTSELGRSLTLCKALRNREQKKKAEKLEVFCALCSFLAFSTTQSTNLHHR